MGPRVRAAGPGDGPVCDAYVRACQTGCFYHLFGWQDTYREALGSETCYLLAERSGEPVGVLPLILVRGFGLGGGFIPSLPGGICTDDERAARCLVDAAIDLVRDRGARYLRLRDSTAVWDDERLVTRAENQNHTLDNLPDDPNLIWRGVKANVRTPVRMARKKGPSPIWGTEHLAGFYHAYASRMRDLGTPALPKRFFEQVVARFPGETRLLTVHLAGRVVGGMLLFAMGERLSTPFSASLAEYFRYGTNDLLYWEAIRHACTQGYRAFDMGRSRPGLGHARFKEKYLVTGKPLFSQYYSRRPGDMIATGGGRWVQVMCALWKRLPVGVATALSPAARRRIPIS